MSGIQSVLHETRIFNPSDEFVRQANVSGMASYQALCKAAEQDYAGYWAKLARETLQWKKPFTKTLDESNAPFFKWFEDGELNVSWNCLDKHLASQPEKTAIIFEADDGAVTQINYRDLHARVCQFANGLKSRGIKKGDRVVVYMPMSIEVVIAMQACARIGAIHSVVFAGFSSKSLHERITDAQACAVITADAQMRGGKVMPLKPAVDEALAMGDCGMVHSVVVYRRAACETAWHAGRDVWWHDLVAGQCATCEPEWVGAEHPLFILYTSGSTGKPKGALHTTAGYLLFVAYTHKLAFDVHENDIWWCTADIGWVTGHSYVIYGPLCNGATSLMFEGVPNYPTYSRFWQIVEKYKVTQFYTAPTAIRAIAKEGNQWVEGIDLSSIRILGSVGEPLNPEAWHWYYSVIGRNQCPIVDTWWQTETGGFMILPLPGAIPIKPALATLPIMGVVPCLVDDTTGAEVKELVGRGALCIKRAWPGFTLTIYKDHKKYEETYFEPFPGYYFTGDGALRDSDGYYRITGRIDDVINVSGHRMGTAEVEAALNSHEKVAESAVVGYPHEIKGQSIYAYVTLNTGVEKSDALKKELVAHVRNIIGPIATPEKIQWADGLPKTRSGKIMRRILKKVAANDVDNLGDTSTLADPSVVADLVKNRQ